MRELDHFNVQLLRAAWGVPMSGPPLADAAVAVRGGKIAAVGAWGTVRQEFPGAPVTDLGASILLPGLINAHCHLDYSCFRGLLPPPASFTAWIQQLGALKAKRSDAQWLASIQEGFTELRRWGTTTVCNMAAFPALLPQLPAPPVRTWHFLELIDLRRSPEALLADALAWMEKRAPPFTHFGLNPHAPYTASEALYRLCAASGRLLSTHLAESREEEEYYRHGRGPLHAFLRKFGAPSVSEETARASAFSHAVAHGKAAPGWLLAHGNELADADLALLARSHAGAPRPWIFVHCPRSHAYFGHAPFRWRELEAAGALLCLGTDSLASNESLNLFEEMRAAQKAAPHLRAEALLKTVTLHPARALRQSGRLGEITPGAHADLLALPCQGGKENVYETILHYNQPIPWMMFDGKISS